MNTRHIAREIILLGFSQLGKVPAGLQKKEFEEILLIVVNTLNNMAVSKLKDSMSELMVVRDYLSDYELNHPSNLKTPIDAGIKPVKLPKTDEFKASIDKMMDAAEHILEARDALEFVAVNGIPEVKEFILSMAKAYIEHARDIDISINRYAAGWNIDRMLKIDKNILRIAVTEIRFFDDVPNSVAADEAVEFAKKYSSEESPRFINGILGQLIADLEGLNDVET